MRGHIVGILINIYPIEIIIVSILYFKMWLLDKLNMWVTKILIKIKCIMYDLLLMHLSLNTH